MNTDEIESILISKLTGLPFYGILPYGGAIGNETLNAILKITGKHEYINTDVVNTVINDAFFNKLKHRIKPDSATKGNLTKLQIEAIAKNVAETLATLPHPYHILLPIPESVEEIEKREMGKDIEIITLTGDVHERYMPKTQDKSGIRGLVSTITRMDRVKNNQNVLIIRVNGYISGFGLLETKGTDPFFYYKVVVAYLHIHGVLKERTINYAFYGQPGYQARKYRYYIHGKDYAHKRTIEETFDDDLVREGFIIENGGDNKYHLMNVIDYLTRFLRDETKVESAVTDMRRKLLQALYWYYEALKSAETHQKAICLCSSVDSIFDVKSHKPDPEKGKYSTPIKCEMIAQTVTIRLDNESFVKDQINEVYKYRDSVIHGKEIIDSIEKFSNGGIPRKVTIRFAQKHIGSFLAERVKRYNLTVSNR